MVHPFPRAMRAFCFLFIFCAFSVRGNSIEAKESSFSLRLIDVETNISPVPVLFLKKKTSVVVEGLGWLVENEVARKIDNSFVHKSNEHSRLIYSTFVNERQAANGTIDLEEFWNDRNNTGFHSSINVGEVEVHKSGLNSIRVELYSVLNGEIIESSASLKIRSHRQWIASIPIIFAFGLFLFFKFHIIHSLFSAMFIGSCIIEGSTIKGFRAVLDTYILQAATDTEHALTLLFIVGISVLMTMIRRSGGTAAVIKSLRQYSSNARVAQFAIFMVGVAFFFDPYVSIMIVGKVFCSILKGFALSNDKISFLIDTTAAPVASIFPHSTWMIFAGNLIQTEIDKIVEFGANDISFPSGYSLVVSSIKYQFYPCFILGLALLQIFTGRDMGTMLKSENKARFNHNTKPEDECRQTIQKRSWNWYIPVFVLNILIWFAFSQIITDKESQDPSTMATTYLTSAVAAIFVTQVIFIIQKRNGKLPILNYFLERRERDRLAYLTDTFPSASTSCDASLPFNLSSKSEDSDRYHRTTQDHNLKVLEMEKGEMRNDSRAKNVFGCLKDAPLMSLHEGIACVVHGIATAIPITLSLIFTWATASVYIALGVDRMIVSWIVNHNFSSEIFPIMVFLCSFLLAMITGSSWCSVSILIPGVMSSLGESLGGDIKVSVLVLASILSGAAAGDHIGPFSETTILSAIITGSEVRRHFLTQAPYALFVFVLSVVVGTLPISYDAYPDYVGHSIGGTVIILFLFIVCRQVERYPSGIPGQIQEEPITQGFRSLIAKKISSTGSSMMSSKRGVIVDNQSVDPTLEPVSVLNSVTQQGTEVVEKGNGKTSIQIQSKRRSYRDGPDSIMGLVEDGILFSDVDDHSTTSKNKIRMIEDTIKKAEQDGNVFSDSLRYFLRTAEHQLGRILEKNENLEITASASQDSTGDDSLDNLMSGIAAKGWRQGINSLLEEDAQTITSGGGEYITDETDDSATNASSSIGGNGQSTYFTGGQSTYFSGNTTSCASTATEAQSESSTLLLNPLDFDKSRNQSLQSGWNDKGELSSQGGDAFSATDFTTGSF